MGTTRPDYGGSCLLVVIPFFVGLGIVFYATSKGFTGAGRWAEYLTLAGIGLAILGPLVVGLSILRKPRKDPEP